MSSLSEVFRDAREDFRTFEKIAQNVERVVVAHTRAVLHNFAANIDRIEGRTKEFVSIRDNYVDEYGIPALAIDIDEFLRDANDLVGVRVVVFYNEDVDAIRDTLMAVYPSAVLDEKLTVRDANKGLRFGYRAVHVNFEFADENILKSQARSKIGVEIQIRTILSDAWARHSHKLAYKPDDPPGDEVLRAFAMTAAMLESIDEKIEGIRLLPRTVERKEVSEELSWTRSYDAISAATGARLMEEDLKSLFVMLVDRLANGKVGDRADEFAKEIIRAWSAFGNVDFARYGLRDPLTQLKMALYGLDRSRYEELVPLHMRSKIEDILQVGVRKS